MTELDGTFLCRDPRTSRGLISPRGNSPILFGVRVVNPYIAMGATNILLEDCSDVIGHRIFKTNQSTGDHIEREYIHNVQNIEIKKGGHVIINKNIICFSDSGDMNILCQWLESGDEISCIGLEYEGKLHLEGIRVLNSVSKLRPMCKCGTRMKSMGKIKVHVVQNAKQNRRIIGNYPKEFHLSKTGFSRHTINEDIWLKTYQVTINIDSQSVLG